MEQRKVKHTQILWSQDHEEQPPPPPQSHDELASLVSKPEDTGHITSIKTD